MKVKVAISARHIHLNKEDFEFLFGVGKELTKLNDLSQKGEFASNEKVSIITEKGRLDNIRIVGPLRNYTQVELSKTDAFKLGLNPPVRNSGDLDNSENLIIEYNGKQLKKDNCCIIANRHMHINTSDLNKYNLKDGQIVKIKISGIKGAILDNVTVKASCNYTLEVHLDVDDGNAHLIDKSNDLVEVIYKWV